MFPTFVLFWILASPLHASRRTSMAQQQASCPPKTCGNLTISDPFWLVQEQGMERPCGLIDYQVYCYNNSPFLRSTIHDGFGILDIFYKNRTFLAADIGKMEDFNSCQAPIINTSFKIGFLPFTISPANREVLIFYYCTEPPAGPQLKQGLVPMKCGNNAFVRAGQGPYSASHDYAEYFIEGCKATLVPVLGASAKMTNAGDYEQLIRDGFLVLSSLLFLFSASMRAQPHRRPLPHSCRGAGRPNTAYYPPSAGEPRVCAMPLPVGNIGSGCGHAAGEGGCRKRLVTLGCASHDGDCSGTGTGTASAA